MLFRIGLASLLWYAAMRRVIPMAFAIGLRRR